MTEASRVVTVVGPTASGKTDLGLALAHALDGEIVNADSMQLYRGMDIGTAKLPPDQREGIPHHLLDLWEPTREASVADYQELGRDAIEEILARGRRAIVVGGSGLYVRALLDRLDFPGTDPEVRARLWAELEANGPEPLHARLSTADPVAAANMHPGNGRRIVRALEVIEVSGRPFSATLPDYGPSRWSAVHLGLDPARPLLDARIAERVQRMWEQGLTEEVRRLAAGPGLGVTASRALGYAQILQWWQGKLPDESAAREATAAATRRFARRQWSWFRRDPRIHWLPVDAGTDRQGLLRMALSAVAPSAR